MNRPAQATPKTEFNILQSLLSLLTVALIGAVMATSQLITGDSITISSGETLPQALLIMIAACIASLAGWQLLPLRRSARLPATLLLVAVVCLVISTVAASIRADGRAAWNNFWHVLALLLFAMMAAQAARRPALSRAFLQLVIVCAVFQSTFAVHQYFVSMPAARAEYLADPDGSILKAQIDAPPGSELRSQYESRLLGSFEPPGTFALTNSLAVLLSGAIVALGSIVLRRTSSAASSIWAMRVVLLLILCVWLLTKSRSGYLAVALVAGISVAISQFRRKRNQSDAEEHRVSVRIGNRGWIIAAVGALLLIGLTIAFLSSDRLVLSEAPKSILYRLEYWQATAKMIGDYPLTGIGLGNFQSYYPAYKLPTASENIADPHNWLFDLAVNCSIPLLATAVLALGWVLRGGLVNVRSAGGSSPFEMNHVDRADVSALWIGALVMFFVTGALQLVLGELIDFDATMLGVLAAAGCWWLTRSLPMTLDTVRHGALLAAITMLVCLLASGSWQASGIALPLAILLSVGHASNQSSSAADSKDRQVGSLIGTALIVIGLIAFVWQTWQPVQSSWALEQQAIAAWQHGRAEAATSLAKEAMYADSLASSPRRLLVQFNMEQAVAAGRRASANEFAQAAAEVDAALADLLDSNPVSNLNYGYAGECNMVLAASTASWNREITAQYMRNAAENYRRAVDRYPSSVALRVQLGVVLVWLDMQGDNSPSASAIEQLDEAIRLSELTPHDNRKLASQQVFLPQPLADRFAAEAVERPIPDSPWAKAEPLSGFLRKLKDT